MGPTTAGPWAGRRRATSPGPGSDRGADVGFGGPAGSLTLRLPRVRDPFPLLFACHDQQTVRSKIEMRFTFSPSWTPPELLKYC